ncbi:ribosome maturation factor RimP [Ammoniphilus sp. YIM 78166]|uniref:ribosome maturation factor RimP n=1 Tax=Ammoniphilus sp. YIM 78166 TaxID=1644106 RepID=UPI00106F3B1C|nr:ribosome maturation factor RimP [Ammoniphilus sp. YIM 78166]
MGKNVTAVVEELVTPILAGLSIELVDIEYVKEGSNWFLRVYIDKEGGVDIEDCGAVSEKLSKRLDEVDPIPDAYFLEVSSPGIERPLKKEKDFHWSIGKRVQVKTQEPIEDTKIFEGTLTVFDNGMLTIEEDEKSYQIPYDKVESARLAFVF